MKWKNEEIKSKIYESVDKRIYQRFEQLVSVLKRREEKEVFNILYEILVDETRSPEQKMYDQEIVGKLLYAIKPVCHIEPLQAVKSILRNYEPSVEEIPFYFAMTLGYQSFLNLLAQIAQEQLSPVEERNLQTFSFWLKSFPRKTGIGSN